MMVRQEGTYHGGRKAEDRCAGDYHEHLLAAGSAMIEVVRLEGQTEAERNLELLHTMVPLRCGGVDVPLDAQNHDLAALQPAPDLDRNYFVQQLEALEMAPAHKILARTEVRSDMVDCLPEPRMLESMEEV